MFTWLEYDVCTCFEGPPVLRDHFCWAEEVVAQDKFYCSMLLVGPHVKLQEYCMCKYCKIPAAFGMLGLCSNVTSQDHPFITDSFTLDTALKKNLNTFQIWLPQIKVKCHFFAKIMEKTKLK